ncbi:MAG: SIMPL domain-containing protein [Clostridia bacterium]|nr:SIMPL domain-containing protein [Clostridia bacterium]
MSTERTIRVTGKGQIRVKPDMTRITMTLEGIQRDYAETLRQSTRSTEQIKDVLEPLGFERMDLKTLQFDVNTEYESYKVHDSYKRRFAGYSYRHVLKIEFDSDRDRLGRILYELAACPARPEFTISYTVKDREASKNELIGKAVEDAKAKAAVLTKAAGIVLGSIQTIDYSWREISFEVHPMEREMGTKMCMDENSERYDLDIEPDDIEASDTVTVVWEII